MAKNIIYTGPRRSAGEYFKDTLQTKPAVWVAVMQI